MTRERGLAREAVRGDEDAWRTIVDAVGPPVLGYARARGIAEPEDVLGDVLLSLVKALRRFEGDLGGIKALALKIARDRIADRFRRRPPMASLPEMPEMPSPDDPASAVAGGSFIIMALQDLPEAQREAVYLRVVCDLSSEEIGRIMGKRPGAVRVLVHRGLARIREQIETKVVTK